MADIANLVVQADATDIRQLNRHLADLSRQSQNTDRATRRLNSGFASITSSLKSLLPAMTAATAALAAMKAAGEMVRVARETEMYIARLKTMTGSLDSAKDAFSRLNEFAKTTPFTLQQSIDGFVKLKALGLDPSERAMRSYGNTAAAMGMDMMQMIEAVADASTGEFERLKSFGIKASQQGDQVSLTFQGVTKTIGKNSKEIQEYLLAIGETNFAGATDDQMDTINGQLSNLKQSFDDLWREMGEAVNATDIIKNALSGISDAVTTTTDIIKTMRFELTVTAEFAAAFAEGHVDFWDWITADKDDAIETLRRLQDELGISSEALALLAKGGKKAGEDVKNGLEKAGTGVPKLNSIIDTIDTDPYMELSDAVNKYDNAIDNAKQNIIWLKEMLEDGIISDKAFKHFMEQNERIINGVKKAEKETKQSTDEMTEAWKDFQRQVENQFIDGFVDQLFSARGEWGDFLEDMLTDWAKAMVKMEMKGLFTGSGGMLSGLMGGSGGSGGFSLSNASTLWDIGSNGMSMFNGGLAGFGANYAASALAGASTVGGMSSQAAMLAAQTAEFGTAGASMTAGALGGGATSTLMAAAPYIAIAALVASQLFKDEDAPTTFYASGGSQSDYKHFNAATTPYGFGNKGRDFRGKTVFGDIGIYTHHASGKEGQMSPEQAQQFAQGAAATIEALKEMDALILKYHDDVDIDAIKAVIEDIEYGGENSGNIKDFFADRINAVADGVGGEFDKLIDSTEGGYEKLLEAAAKYFTNLGSLDDLAADLSGEGGELNKAKKLVEELSATYGNNNAELLDYIQANQDSIAATEGATQEVYALSHAFNVINDAAQRAEAAFMRAAQGIVNSIAKFNTQAAVDITKFVGLSQIAQANEGIKALGFDYQIDTSSLSAIKNSMSEIGGFLASGGDQFTGDQASAITSLYNSIASSISQYESLTETTEATTEETTTSIDNFTSSISNLNNEIDDITPQIEELIREFENAMNGIKNLRQSIRNDMYGFGVNKDFDSILTDLYGGLTGGSSDIGIYNEIRQTIVEKYNTEIQKVQEVNQEKIDAYEAEKQRVEDLNAAYKSIGEFVSQMGLSGLSPYSSFERLNESRGIYGSTLLKAQAGDLEALGNVTGAAEDYLTNKLATARTGLEYRKIFNQVRSSLAPLGEKQLTVEEMTLDVTKDIEELQSKAVEELLNLDSEVVALQEKLTTEFKTQTDALLSQLSGDTSAIVAAINSALAISTQPTGNISTINSDDVRFNSAVETALNTGVANNNLKLTQDELVNSYFNAYLGRDASAAGLQSFSGLSASEIESVILGSSEYQNKIAQYSTGTDYVPKDGLAFIHKGEAVLNRTDNQTLSKSIMELKEENRSLNLSLIRLTDKMKKTFDKWDDEGLPDVRAA